MTDPAPGIGGVNRKENYNGYAEDKRRGNQKETTDEDSKTNDGLLRSG